MGALPAAMMINETEQAVLWKTTRQPRVVQWKVAKATERCGEDREKGGAEVRRE